MTKMSLSERMDMRVANIMQPGVTNGSREYELRRDLRVPMSDGTILLADLRLPVGEIDPRTPTVLVRSPYGRRSFIGAVGAAMASNGFPALVESCRGTFGSGGTFRPQLDEQSDGIDTHRWVRAQPWFTGKLVTMGPSYLGYTQWAVAGKLARDDPENAPDALCLAVTMPDFGEITWDNGAFSLRNALGWTRMVSNQGKRGRIFDMVVRAPRANRRGFAVMPLGEGDTAAVGRPVDWYQDWLRFEDLGSDYWTQQSHTASVPDVTAPVMMVTGWHDIFLPWMLRDYATLVAAGNPPELTIGPWSHASQGVMAAGVNLPVDFLQRTFLGAVGRPEPVRILLTGTDDWYDLPSWPPPGTVERQVLLAPHGALSELAPTDAVGVTAQSAVVDAVVPTRYRYDPSDPTPAVGGPSLEPRAPLAEDNAEHEKRTDVVTFTGDALVAPLDVAGEPVATLFVRSDRPSFDVFVRICDVDADGRSMTVCDGIRRIGSVGTVRTDPTADGDGVRAVEVRLWPTAHRFAVGHRIRIQVSSGAHPRYSRNPGSGEPAVTASELFVANQEVFHDASRPSGVRLPVWEH